MARYKNCPKCGALCRYVSENFEHVDILIAAEESKAKKELEHTYKFAEMLQKIVETRIQDLNSDQLYYLYRCKLQEETIKKQHEEDEFYRSMVSVDKFEYDKFIAEHFKKMMDL